MTETVLLSATVTVTVVHPPGEIFELKAELNNEKKEKRKEAVKKVIAAMTVGKDVRYRRKFGKSCLELDRLINYECSVKHIKVKAML